MKTSDNPDRDADITKASSYEQVQESGTQLEISEVSETEEDSGELKSKVSSEEFDPDDEDTAEAGTTEDNGVEENGDDQNLEETSENKDG